ncbi:hypothetical protein [Deinococcus koreensis]|uniref:Uncharacterized protein n=1 Tax=Deinococcus koreensis TaxID=2054903 RepID=A0A2K3UY35_9DEIO|nr:hypothetical protein [Deinococcus koreensis]PNY81444.1 hypothetical protein CVO96_08665 [Deinococcus koreensis]
MKRLSGEEDQEGHFVPRFGERGRFRFEVFQVVDMQALPQRQVRLSVLLSPHLQPGDEVDLRPYGLWQVVSLEASSRPDVTTLIVRHQPD